MKFFGQEKHMTNVHHSGGKTPSWNSVFKTRISNFSESIRVQVWDKDTFSADNMVGEGFISIEKIALGQGVQIHDCQLSYKQYSNTGVVTFEVEWFPDGVQQQGLQQVYQQQQPYQQQVFQQQQPLIQNMGFQQQQQPLLQNQGFNQGFQQQNMGGFQQQQPYQQQNQGFNQGGFQQQQPYQQQGFQQQQPFQQQGFQQNQGFNQQGGMNQGFNQQGGFNQGFQQQNMGGFQQQQPYQQQGLNQGGFQQQPYYQQQGFQQQGLQQGFGTQNFVIGQRFATWTYKTHLSRSEIKKHCKHIFKKYDRDRSKYLDEKELFGAIQEFFMMIGSPCPPIEIVWDLMDIYSYRGGRCKVNKKQFRTIIKELCGLLNENQRQKRHKNKNKFFF